MNKKKLLIIQKLRSENISIRRIARRTRISKSTIHRILGQFLGQFPRDEDSENLGQFLGHSWDKINSIDDKVEKHVLKSNISRSRLSVPTRTQQDQKLELPQLELGQQHNHLFCVRYSGIRPIINEFEYNKNKASVITKDEDIYLGEDTIQIHKNTIEVWIRYTKGDTIEEIKARGKGRARLLLAYIAKKYNLLLFWETLKVKSEMHINFTNKHEASDQLILNLARDDPKRAKNELGILAGDNSHKDQTEFIGKEGQLSFDALSFAIKQLPRLAFDYNKNLHLHVEVQQQQKANLIQMNKNLMKMNSLLKKIEEKL